MSWMKRIKPYAFLFALLLHCVVSFAYEPHDDPPFERPEDYRFDSYADITMTSDLVIRGLTFSDHHANVQGAFGVRSIYGVFGQIYTASQDFSLADRGVATVNTTLTLGWNMQREGYEVNVVLNDYLYPNETQYNYWEVMSIFDYRLLRFEVGYTPHWWGIGGEGIYSAIGLHVPLSKYTASFLQYFSFGGHVGFYAFQGEVLDGKDYNDYEAYVAVEKNGWKAAFKYTDTNGGFGGNVGNRQFIGVLTYATY